MKMQRKRLKKEIKENNEFEVVTDDKSEDNQN